MSDKAWTVGYIIDWWWHSDLFFSPCRWNHIQVVQRHHSDGKNSVSECQRVAEDFHQNNGHDLSNVEPLVEAHISRTDGDAYHRPHTEHLWHTLPGKSRLTGDNELQFDLQNVFKHCQHSVLNQYNYLYDFTHPSLSFDVCFDQVCWNFSSSPKPCPWFLICWAGDKNFHITWQRADRSKAGLHKEARKILKHWFRWKHVYVLQTKTKKISPMCNIKL